MNQTALYIAKLESLKTGDLGLLAINLGKGLDESIQGFDLFSGLWWPLRKKNPQVPRRKVAWLIAKLYASCPVPHSTGHYLPVQLALCVPHDLREKYRFKRRFDLLLTMPVGQIEQEIRWVLGKMASRKLKLDWVQLTGDLSNWERERTRFKWAEQFLNELERRQS